MSGIFFIAIPFVTLTLWILLTNLNYHKYRESQMRILEQKVYYAKMWRSSWDALIEEEKDPEKKKMLIAEFESQRLKMIIQNSLDYEIERIYRV